MNDPKRLFDHPEALSPEEFSALRAGVAMRAPEGLAGAVWAGIVLPIPSRGSSGAAPAGSSGEPEPGPIPSSSGALGGLKAAAVLKGGSSFGIAKFFVVGAIAGSTVATAVVRNSAHSPGPSAVDPSGASAAPVGPSGIAFPTYLSGSADRVPPAREAAGAKTLGAGPVLMPAADHAFRPTHPSLSASAPSTSSVALSASAPSTSTSSVALSASAPSTPSAASIAQALAASETLPRDPRQARTKAEVMLVQLARDALRSGDAHAALAYLDEASRQIPDGVLGQEREVLTIEALAATNRVDAASERAKTYLGAHPESPFVARVRKATSR